MSLLPLLAILAGLPVLIWSADRFVLGASALARHFGMPALLIGMLIVGFGTSAPEMLVSAIAAWQGNPGLALGNAYGSNIANIALILGLTAVLAPISVHSAVVRREIPVLLAVTACLAFVLAARDAEIAGVGGAALLGSWLGLIANSAFVVTLHWRHLWVVAALIWAGYAALRPARPSG